MGKTADLNHVEGAALESKAYTEAACAALVQAVGEELGKKQDSFTGTAGQVVGFNANGRPVAQAAPSGKLFEIGTSPPGDTGLLWIDTTANTGGLKYYNGSAWVAVPVIWG